MNGLNATICLIWTIIDCYVNSLAVMVGCCCWTCLLFGALHPIPNHTQRCACLLARVHCSVPLQPPAGPSLSGQSSDSQLSSHPRLMYLSSPLVHIAYFPSKPTQVTVKLGILLSCPCYNQHIRELLMLAEPGGPGWDSDAKSNMDRGV